MVQLQLRLTEGATNGFNLHLPRKLHPSCARQVGLCCRKSDINFTHQVAGGVENMVWNWRRLDLNAQKRFMWYFLIMCACKQKYRHICMYLDYIISTYFLSSTDAKQLDSRKFHTHHPGTRPNWNPMRFSDVPDWTNSLVQELCL